MTANIAIAVKGAITDKEEGLDAPLDPRFGRAEGFLVVTESGEATEYVANPNVQAPHGAGSGSAALVGDHGVSHVISGHFGPKAARALQAMGVQMWSCSSERTAREAWQAWKNGALEQARFEGGGSRGRR